MNDFACFGPQRRHLFALFAARVGSGWFVLTLAARRSRFAASFPGFPIAVYDQSGAPVADWLDPRVGHLLEEVSEAEEG